MQKDEKTMASCKITVLKRTLNSDLAAEYVEMTVQPCGAFREGQEFIVSADLGKPEGFCTWAWDDIYKTVVTLARGGNFSDGIFQGWMKNPHCMVTCCSDGIRPVIFKVERREE
jgi:uncharacterized repeat protein (TIGR04076 family)